jgi:hypothetical protein
MKGAGILFAISILTVIFGGGEDRKYRSDYSFLSSVLLLQKLQSHILSVAAQFTSLP